MRDQEEQERVRKVAIVSVEREEQVRGANERAESECRATRKGGGE